MKYKLSEIDYVEAVKISGYKTDVQVQVTIKLKKAIDVENLQVKLVSNPKGFNQIDKRWVEKYTESPAPDTTFEIDLEYFNSSASKTLYKIFSDLIEISDRTNLTVKWHYYDEDSLEVANDYETILGFKMVLIDATER